MRKRSTTLSCLVGLSVLLLLLATRCGEDQLAAPEESMVTVAPTPPEGLDALDIDTLRVEIRDARTGRLFIGRSEYCQSVQFELPMGNYSLRILGSKTGKRMVRQFSYYSPNLALSHGAKRVSAQLESAVTLNPQEEKDEELQVLKVQLRAPTEAAYVSLAGVSVNLSSLKEGTQQTQTSNGKGQVVFHVKPGQYTLTASAIRKLTTPKEETLELFTAPQKVRIERDALAVELRLRLVPQVEAGEGELDIAIGFTDAQHIPAQRVSTITLRKLPNGKAEEFKTNAEGKLCTPLPYGTYIASAQLETLDASGLRVMAFSSQPKEILHDGKSKHITLEMPAPEIASSIVFKEIYFSCSRNCATQEPYDTDRYVVLYNNSAYPVYVDGLAFCSTFQNTMLPAGANFYPQYAGTNLIVPGFIFSIPGNGQEHLLAPGQSLVIADQALNHKAINPCCPVDLSHADYEWYDNHFGDVDVPEVPNMEKWFSYSATVTVLHNRGYWSYFLFKPPDGNMQSFLNSHVAETVNPNGSEAKIYVVPADLILDGVQCAAPEGPKLNTLPSSVDAGYTFCSGPFIAKSVHRKLARSVNGRVVLQDTNDSSNDFTPNATPHPRTF